MLDTHISLTILYGMSDDFCKCQSIPGCTPGPEASLTSSEVVTLVIFSQWSSSAVNGTSTVMRPAAFAELVPHHTEC